MQWLRAHGVTGRLVIDLIRSHLHVSSERPSADQQQYMCSSGTGSFTLDHGQFESVHTRRK